MDCLLQSVSDLSMDLSFPQRTDDVAKALELCSFGVDKNTFHSSET